MRIAAQLLLIALSVGGLLAAMAGVYALARRYGWSAELQRKCVHVTTGLYALSLPLTFSEAWPVLLLCAVAIVVMAAMRLPVLARTGIASTIHGVARTSYGEILLAVSVGFLFLRSLGQPVLFVLPMLVLTLSYAAAALTGVRYGRRLFAVENGTKSLEGVAMFFLVTIIIAMVTLLLMTDLSRPGVIVMALTVAAFGAQIEADSWRGFDNLFVPVGIHLYLQNNLELTPVAIAAGALVYVAMLSALLLAAPRLGITAHAARGYGILAFLILSVTAPHNAILPLAAFAMFLLLRRIDPCRSAYPDLDFIAAAAVTAAWWLFAGEWSGDNVINLYNLTFAGVAAAFAVIALRDRSLAIAAALVIGLALCVLAIAPFNASESHWMPAFAVVTLVSLALVSATALRWPDAFRSNRAARVFALALPVPLLLFIWKALLS